MRIISLPVALLFCIFFLPPHALADGITYKVKKGDSLYKISKKFKVPINEIKIKNSMSSSYIQAGTKLCIPTKDKNRNEESAGQDSISGHGEKTSVAMPKDAARYHIVGKGDSLSEISKRYAVSVRDLRKLNNLRSTRIKPGQQLLVKKIVPKTYVVRKGDTLSKIAGKFSIDIDELRDINGLETDLLKPGQNLFLKQETEAEEQKQYATILSRRNIDKDVPDVSMPEDLGLKDKLILFAKKFMNIPYRFGGTSIFGIDCSGYVQKVYSMIGVNLPRSAREQFREGQPVNTGDLSIGDLVFFRTYAPFPSHVGIYLGDNLFIHASSREKKVTIDSLTEPFYIKRFIGAKRVLKEDTPEGG